ncbi:MAG: hypothetical protein EBR09_10025 [Proteobacteria bacterium]|nr:hypothetical protein [Pseudomonadota bacterium]
MKTVLSGSLLLILACVSSNAYGKEYIPAFGPCKVNFKTERGGSGSFETTLSRPNCLKKCDEYSCKSPVCLWYSEKLPVKTPPASACKPPPKK